MTKIRFLIALLACGTASAPALADLPRRASLGIAMAPQDQSGTGATVSQVLPNSTAAAIGLTNGDVIVRAGASAVTGAEGVIAYAGTLRGADPVSLTVRRAGREQVLQGPAIARPMESYAGARTDYGEVAFRDGRLRDILVLPDGVQAPPVVYLIQGFSCTSMENPDYRRLGEELIRAGIGYYRVEKPGVGDSLGGPQCDAIDYATELDAFRTAYRHLVDRRGVAAERIFMLGHSLGGIEAPMLAAEQPPRGVAVYGTVFRNWHDYHRDVGQFQSYLFSGADLAEATARAESIREVFRRFYLLRETPAEVAAANPAYGEGLRTDFAWDGGERVFGRHYRYAQDLAHLPLIAAWRDARTNVLAMYGESDLVALFDEDHRLIADLANQLHPGSGRYVEIAGTGHGMDLIGNRLEVRERTRAAGTPPQGEFNPEVARVLATWIREAMARPPVSAGAPAASG